MAPPFLRLARLPPRTSVELKLKPLTHQASKYIENSMGWGRIRTGLISCPRL